MRILHTGFRTAVTAAIICGFCAPAAAQSDEDGATLYGMLSTTTTIGIVITIGGGVLTTVVLLTRDEKNALKTYIRENAVALRGDITRGGGGTVADLAQIFGVPDKHLKAFARAVRTRRDTLLSLIGPDPIDDQRTERFVETVWQALGSDEELAFALAARQG